MSETQFDSDKIAQHFETVINSLDGEVARIDAELGRGIRRMEDSDDIITLATPDKFSDGETMMYVNYVPHVGDGDAGVAVTDVFSAEDHAWEGDDNLYEVLKELVSDGYLIVVDDDIGLFRDDCQPTREVVVDPDKLAATYRLVVCSPSVDRVVRVYGVRGDGKPDDVLRTEIDEPLSSNEWFPESTKAPIDMRLNEFFEDRVETAPKREDVREIRDDGDELTDEEVDEIHLEWLDDWEKNMVRNRIDDTVEIRGETYDIVFDN